MQPIPPIFVSVSDTGNVCYVSGPMCIPMGNVKGRTPHIEAVMLWRNEHGMHVFPPRFGLETPDLKAYKDLFGRSFSTWLSDRDQEIRSMLASVQQNTGSPRIEIQEADFAFKIWCRSG